MKIRHATRAKQRPDRFALSILPGCGQGFLVAPCQPAESAVAETERMYGQIANALADNDLLIVHERLFGSLVARSAVMAARQRILDAHGIPSDGPLTYIEGHPPWGEGLAGALIRAIPQTHEDDAWQIRQGDICVGRGWRHAGMTFLLLQDVQESTRESGLTKSPVTQTRDAIDRAAHALSSQGASYRDVVRTWCYLANILDWYGEFNAARSARYDDFDLLPQSGDDPFCLPASTGIAGRSMPESAITLDLLAVHDDDGQAGAVRQVGNAMQADAHSYGSAFSRAAVVSCAGDRLVEVSGTAAIDENGRSLYHGDVDAQIARTLDTIEALLDEQGATMRDIRAATVFLKRGEDVGRFETATAARNLADLPCVCVVADICRAELLFEIEATAVVPRTRDEAHEGG